jgi:poly(hydroxyalkanoate) depolymerase family esterase
VLSPWSKLIGKGLQQGVRQTSRVAAQAIQQVAERRRAPPGEGDWLPGLATCAAGMRRFHLYRPPGLRAGEKLPLLVMLHGCGQDARGFAKLTRMNRLAARERFMVLYPEQDRLSNGHGCWHWFDTRTGRAFREAAIILAAIDQVCLLNRADRSRVALAGLSAGASMAALLAIHHPERFRAVVMHSGLPPGAADTRVAALEAMQGQSNAMRRVAEAAPREPVTWPPLLVIHGGRDAIVARDNATAAAALWAQAAGARAGVARTVQRGQRYPMAVTDHRARGRLVAREIAIEHLGHAWSGGTAREPFADALGPDASRLAWRFVAQCLEAGP